MTNWRGLALALGALLVVGGFLWWGAGGGPVILIIGFLALATAAFEPVYGRASTKPASGDWRATGEKFVDPETGRLVTVWFDPESGERRYVEDEA